MSYESDLERLVLKKTLDDYLGTESSYESNVNALVKSLMSNHPVRLLGHSKDGEVWLSEEDRESHIHIIGSPGEGKSKFLEMMVSKDIESLIKGKSKSGALFIDSSDNGNTMKKVLRYCCKRGFEKVLLIDPHNIQDLGFVVPINPIDYDAPHEAVEAHIMDCIRILWQTEDFSKEAIISTYLPHIIRAIHGAGYTLPDAECFSERDLANQRFQVLDKLDPQRYFITHRKFARIYTKERDWHDFAPTARRLDPFYHSVMKLTFGSRKGVDFKKLIADGWVILVNLYPVGLFEEKHQRLLGTAILNEIIRAMSRIKHHNPAYNIPYYIYIDEFGQYATPKIANILHYSRQSGIRMNLAHQEFAQIENPKVLNAVKSAAKTKIAFYTAAEADRLQIVKMCYGGALPDREVAYVLSQTKKQQAVIKINKADPVVTRIRDWPDAKVEQKVLTDYILKLYANAEHYRPKAEVWAELKQRFATTPTQGKATFGAAQHAPQSRSKTPRTKGHAAPGDIKNGTSDQTPVDENAPVEERRDVRSVLSKIKRQKGVPPSLISKHPRDDEQVGE